LKAFLNLAVAAAHVRRNEKSDAALASKDSAVLKTSIERKIASIPLVRMLAPAPCRRNIQQNDMPNDLS